MGRLIKGKSFYNKPWYSSYRAMMDRCYRKNASNYSNYGGRGAKLFEKVESCKGNTWEVVNGRREWKKCV